MNRLPAMQLWPPLTMRAVAAISAACRGIGVGQHDVGVRAAELEHRLLQRAAGRRATWRPAGTLPVRVTAAIAGPRSARARLGPGSAGCGTGPPESPLRGTSSSSASAQPGTFEACLSTAALPAIRPGAAKRITCQNGKFHGMTASTTPSGLKVTKALPVRPCPPAGRRQQPLRVARRTSRSRPGALLDLGAALGQGLAHLRGHQLDELGAGAGAAPSPPPASAPPARRRRSRARRARRPDPARDGPRLLDRYGPRRRGPGAPSRDPIVCSRTRSSMIHLRVLPMRPPPQRIDPADPMGQPARKAPNSAASPVFTNWGARKRHSGGYSGSKGRRYGRKRRRQENGVRKLMRVLILGGDGFCGWPTALHLSARATTSRSSTTSPGATSTSSSRSHR